MASVEELGLQLDSLINIDFVGRGLSQRLFEAATIYHGSSLTALAAGKLEEAVNPGDAVLILTGFRTPPLFIQETDGPLGAASLARAVDIALEGRPVIVTENEETSLGITIATCRGAGLSLIPIECLMEKEIRHAAAITAFTMKEEKALEEARSLIERIKPKAVISIEKCGKNRKGIYHNQGGMDVSNYHCKIEYLIEEASRRGILTIGIGDGGNEVGMGVIENTVRKYIDNGEKCICPCGAGIASVSKVDILVTANVSNWGGYAVAGLLAKLKERPHALHSQENEELMFQFSMMAGAIDGDQGVINKSADNMGIEVHKSILALIRQLLFHIEHPVASGVVISS